MKIIVPPPPQIVLIFLENCFSHSLSSSLFHTSFKEGVCIPVFKSVYKSLPSKYRPISLTYVLAKVIERLIVIKSSLSYVIKGI